jgi:hypothetical protein
MQFCDTADFKSALRDASAFCEAVEAIFELIEQKASAL